VAKGGSGNGLTLALLRPKKRAQAKKEPRNKTMTTMESWVDDRGRGVMEEQYFGNPPFDRFKQHSSLNINKTQLSVV
jgi:hypothetical protein